MSRSFINRLQDVHERITDLEPLSPSATPRKAAKYAKDLKKISSYVGHMTEHIHGLVAGSGGAGGEVVRQEVGSHDMNRTRFLTSKLHHKLTKRTVPSSDSDRDSESERQESRATKDALVRPVLGFILPTDHAL
jgi:hypothetical protein